MKKKNHFHQNSEEEINDINRRGKSMLDKTLAQVIWLAVGLVGIALAILLVWPIFSTNVKHVEDKNITIPAELSFYYLEDKDIV